MQLHRRRLVKGLGVYGSKHWFGFRGGLRFRALEWLITTHEPPTMGLRIQGAAVLASQPVQGFLACLELKA